MSILEQFSWANNYIQYLELRKRGLKKQANTSLQSFIKDFQLQDKPNRRRFFDVVNRTAYLTNDFNL